mmetsp:Transcript_8030/g.11035  ORF Transcript_8030/g.11035 Transcript_8030/m.11035 type:complete len:334 (+) Transcript_8030:23-1024(+)
MAHISPAVIELSISEQQDNDGAAFPLLLGPQSKDTFTSSKEVLEWVKNNQTFVEEKLGKHGAILFRGFPLTTPDEFHDFLKGFDYEFRHQFNGGGGPRKLIVGPIQTSTESPPEFTIPFHHELAYLTSQPSKLFFFCEIPPAAKGETPLCLSHRVYKKAVEKNKAFIDKITEKKIRYTRILADKSTGKNLDYQRAWQDIYDTEDRKVAEERALASGTETVEWLDDNSMKVVSIPFPAIRVDPRHNKETWFNSAILLHPGVYGMSKDFNAWETTFADFSPIDPKDLLEVRAIMEAEGVAFKWQQGDVLLVDNFLALHSRNSFTPPRRILAAMAV